MASKRVLSSAEVGPVADTPPALGLPTSLETEALLLPAPSGSHNLLWSCTQAAA